MQRPQPNISVSALAAAASVTLALTLSMAGLVKHYAPRTAPQVDTLMAQKAPAAATDVAIIPARIEVVVSRTQNVAANPHRAQTI
jgi:hypothetical protein